jgi:hypothetical protein
LNGALKEALKGALKGLLKGALKGTLKGALRSLSYSPLYVSISPPVLTHCVVLKEFGVAR